MGLPPVMAVLGPMAPWPLGLAPTPQSLVGQSTLPALGPHQGVSDPPTDPLGLSLWQQSSNHSGLVQPGCVLTSGDLQQLWARL